MIHKSVLLACDAARAFSLFTEEAGLWWPLDRRHTKDAESAIRMTAAGRFWERARDGHEVELGCVRVWEPGLRLVLDFYVGTNADAPTEVEVRFAHEAPGTRVTIIHRPGRAGPLWDERWPRFERSWTSVLAAVAVYDAAHGHDDAV